MVRSIDEIFGMQQNRPRTIDEIFSTPEPVTQPPSFSMPKMLSAHTPILEQKEPNALQKFGKGVVDSSVIGRTGYKLGAALRNGDFRAPIPYLPNYQPKTFTDKALNVAGSLAGDAGLWGAGELALAKPLASLAKTAPVAKLTSAIPKALTPALGTGIKAGATYAGPINLAETALNRDGVEGFTERLKEAPLMALGGTALHGAGQLVGKGIRGGVDLARSNSLNRSITLPEINPLKEVQNAYRAPSLRDARGNELLKTFANKEAPLATQQRIIPRLPLANQVMTDAERLAQRQLDAQSVFGGHRDLKKYSFTSGEQRAFQELQDGITEAQNYVRHTDVLAPYPPGTTVEAAYADVKANTGVDLPKLIGNWERAQVKRTSLNSQELKIGRAAGVIPQLKPRYIPRPMLNTIEVPSSRIDLPRPKPLQWTNRDGIQSAGPLPIRSITPDILSALPKSPSQVKQAERVFWQSVSKDLHSKGEFPPVSIELMKKEILEGKIDISKLSNAEEIRKALEMDLQKFADSPQLPSPPDLSPLLQPLANRVERPRVMSAETQRPSVSIELPNPHAPRTQTRSMGAKIETPRVALSLTPEINPLSLSIKDIGHFKAYTSDVYRIMRDALGKDAGNKFTKPLDIAKGANAEMQIRLTSKLKKDIVDGLGIKKGSKESALVQRYGEGNITLEELKQASPKKWQDIVEADKWFRREYDELIDTVNASKKQIYPNAENAIAKVDAEIEKIKADRSLSSIERMELLNDLDVRREKAMRSKIIPKRADYYRHFKEMAEGVEGLKNIFDSPANIDTQLIGRSEFTTPRSRWASFAQKRTGEETTEDAVGGFLNYIPSASYATHIDPQIARIREFTQTLRDTTEASHTADNLIGFLDKYANDLAGKTNPFLDRTIKDSIPGGRKTFAVLTLLNNRVKANVVLGKASSMLAQLANIPNGIAYSKQYALPGLISTVKSSVKPGASANSPFLKERFIGSAYRQFNESLLDKPKDLAVYLMETADKIGTNFIWNSAYAKGIAQKVANPIRYADMATRDLVAGRGIGEVPIIQKSKVFQILAPFQLEVANLWHVQKDFLKAKDFGALISLYFLNYAFNEIMENTRGSKVVFDPIRATKDALTEKNISPLQRAGRVGGEVLSNVPLGQTVAAMWPEYGTEKLWSRKEFFGATDPTRFGSNILLAKAVQDPLFKLAPSFGGEQIKKTFQGISDLNKGGHYASTGKLSYPVKPTLPNAIKGTLFGPSAFDEARPYYDKNLRPLSKEQTKQVLKSPNQYDAIQKQRSIDSIESEMANVQKDDELTNVKRARQIELLKARLLDIQRGR